MLLFREETDEPRFWLPIVEVTTLGIGVAKGVPEEVTGVEGVPERYVEGEAEFRFSETRIKREK